MYSVDTPQNIDMASCNLPDEPMEDLADRLRLERISDNELAVEDMFAIFEKGEVLSQVAVGLGVQDYALLFRYEQDYYVVEARMSVMPRRFEGNMWSAHRVEPRCKKTYYWARVQC